MLSKEDSGKFLGQIIASMCLCLGSNYAIWVGCISEVLLLGVVIYLLLGSQSILMLEFLGLSVNKP